MRISESASSFGWPDSDENFGILFHTQMSIQNAGRAVELFRRAGPFGSLAGKVELAKCLKPGIWMLHGHDDWYKKYLRLKPRKKAQG
jgi:hypothetical protein